jgi:hypothetical protein
VQLTSELAGNDAASEYAAETFVLGHPIERGSTPLNPFHRELAIIDGQL